MPCYEAPLPHQERLPEFLTAALCYATSKLAQEDLAGFPGLAEWRRRHDFIDAREDKYFAAAEYEQAQTTGQFTTGYSPPKFMREFMAAFPKAAEPR